MAPACIDGVGSIVPTSDPRAALAMTLYGHFQDKIQGRLASRKAPEGPAGSPLCPYSGSRKVLHISSHPLAMRHNGVWGRAPEGPAGSPLPPYSGSRKVLHISSHPLAVRHNGVWGGAPEGPAGSPPAPIQRVAGKVPHISSYPLTVRHKGVWGGAPEGPAGSPLRPYSGSRVKPANLN